ncbi:HAMP domain-containing histidine kinase [Pantoea sp. Tr-811]|uniref:sensor histidine kinase n=1 Tax=unclassified Pantoea TaxID=2630326 RepID=UPI00141EEE0E|nr:MULTISPECIES: HAMP domain-containing sensor histidine kinase [unclassified Pantoea]NIE73199.1 HAMP domain-containing histidine kinase [Pantoea sp. Ap-967]NIF29793.1 HAMP domain-containing histidine kinase [Pantoea sp. Tr-811]
MSWAELRPLLTTSSLRQATTIAFICLLFSLISIVLSNQLLEVVMRSHVRDMILNDVRSQQLQGAMVSAERLSWALRYRQQLDVRKERQATVVDRDGKLLFGSRGLLPEPTLPASDRLRWYHITLTNEQGEAAEVLGLTITLGDGGQYYSAFDLRPMLERTRIIPLATGAGLLLLLLSILITALPFGLHNLYRINRIRDALARYANGDYTAMAPAVQHGDEFDQLGIEINHGLRRINKLMDEVKHITSHIAHELRTPLTRLQSRLLNASEHLQGPAREELLCAVQDSERIQHLFRAVMRIAEVETGRMACHFEVIDVRELLEDVAEYYQPLADERGCRFELEVQKDCQLFGDRALLFQALANLIDNALKYAPPGLAITLAARGRNGQGMLQVRDRGPGISAAHSERAMERFQRLEPKGDVHGHGLGLTLVRAIAEVHGGDLRLGDNQPGLAASLNVRKQVLAGR